MSMLSKLGSKKIDQLNTRTLSLSEYFKPKDDGVPKGPPLVYYVSELGLVC